MAEPVTQEQRVATLVGFADALQDPCVLLDRRLVVMHCNAAARTEFPALSTGSLLTRAIRNPALLNAIEAAWDGGQAQSVEMHQAVPNATWHRADVALLPGDSGLVVVVLRSLTEQKRIEQLRSDFIANASHELRTPLTSLVGFIDTLLGPAANDEGARRRFLTIMRQQAGRMSKLIDDLLSLSRIEMRQHMRPTGEVDLDQLLREVVDGLAVQAAEAGVIINIQGGAAIAAGDHGELHEVFENLIDNAIKYGGDGRRVDVVLAAGRSGYDHVVSVTDYGAGIEPHHVPRLTERFYRIDAESSRKKKGTGLGLAIVKHIIHRHHGLLTIKSTPGEGTRVEVLLNK